MTLAEQFRVGRTKAGLTQSQLADLAGVPQSMISEVESGKRLNPRYDAVVRVLSVLSASVPGTGAAPAVELDLGAK